MRVLVLDIGGSHIQAYVPGRRDRLEIESGRHMTPEVMIRALSEKIAGKTYEAVTLGYPGRVDNNRIEQDAPNLGKGWVGFDFRKAFRKRVKILNDAALQALGSYRGGRMLFLGLGTALGSALILDGMLHALELGMLPYRQGRPYFEYLGKAGLQRLGHRCWARHVLTAVRQFRTAFQVDYLVLGGGQTQLIHRMPQGVIRGDNSKALLGGRRAWSATFDRVA